MFKKLQIPGEVMDIDDKGDTKGDDDDDDAPSSKGTPKEDTAQEKPEPSSTPLQKS